MSPKLVVYKFWSRVDRQGLDDCWNWTAAKNSEGYGQISRNGKLVYAHRLSYEIHHGSIPAQMDLCHKCDNPACVNPSHLFVGTRSDNAKDMVQKGRFTPPGYSGEKHPGAKLSLDEVRSIRDLYATGKYSQRNLARKFLVTQAQIWQIVNHKNWN